MINCKILWFVMLMVSGLSPSYLKSATIVNAWITTDQTWNPAGSPYILQSDCEIGSGAKLTILPGTRIVASGNYKLIVKGRIRAIGKTDSIITFDSMYVELNKAVSYKHSDSSGSRFTYCRFFAHHTSGYMVTTKGTDIGLDHCEFLRGYYGVYAQSTDSVKVYVTNSVFNGYSYGYPVYGLYENSYLYLSDNQFLSFGYIYLGARNVLKGNYFLGTGNSYGLYTQYYTKEVEISCNHFRKMNYAIYVSSVNPAFKFMKIHDNLFDSCNHVLYLYCSSLPIDSIDVTSNNFQRSKYAVYISGCSSPTYKTWDVQQNYWGTTDTNAIKASIYDRTDLATTSWVVNYKSFLTNPVSPCWPKNAVILASREYPEIQADVHPNPASGLVELVLPQGDWKLSWYDLSGRLLLSNQYYGSRITAATPDFAGTVILRWSNGLHSASQLITISPN